MSGIVDQGLPPLGVDVIVTKNEVAAHVHFENTHLDRGASTKLVEPRLSLKPVNFSDACLQLHGA